MKLIPCKETAATHVQVLPDKHRHYKLLNVMPYGVYPLEYTPIDDEEFITNEEGVPCCSFSLAIKVRWLREVRE